LSLSKQLSPGERATFFGRFQGRRCTIPTSMVLSISNRATADKPDDVSLDEERTAMDNDTKQIVEPAAERWP